jgi:tryptophanyl-tRNA synthetase
LINIFLADKKLRKQIMSIQTASTPLEDPKDTEVCNTFALYKLLASEEQTVKMRANYAGGNYGFGHAKQELFELICEKFSKERELYNYYMENLSELEDKLKIGADKARLVAKGVVGRVRERLGY